MKKPIKHLAKPVDEINSPPHYTSSESHCATCKHPIECIDVTRHMGFSLGNIIKYLWRWKHKDGVKDLKKAAWYLNDLIKQTEEQP